MAITSSELQQQATVIYTRADFKFSLANGKLIAEFKGKKLPLASPMEISFSKWQELIKTNNINTLLNIFNNSYFIVQFGQIKLHMRGLLGGWGELQHAGYFYPNADDQTTIVYCDDDLYRAVPPAGYSQYYLGGGTHDWACAMGFGKLQPKDPQELIRYCGTIIGDANNGIDYGDTSPTNILSPFRTYAQSYHFSVFKYQAGYFGDTRLIHAINHLVKAIYLFNINRRQSLEELGKGLHPLQDILAHGDTFVSIIDLPGEDDIFHHFGTASATVADEVNFIADGSAGAQSLLDQKFNQRYTNTKIMSFIYLWLYKDIVTKIFALPANFFEEDITAKPPLTRENIMESILTTTEITKLRDTLGEQYEQINTRKELILILATHFTDTTFKHTFKGFMETINLILQPHLTKGSFALFTQIDERLQRMFNLYPPTKGQDLSWARQFTWPTVLGEKPILQEVAETISLNFHQILHWQPFTTITGQQAKIPKRGISIAALQEYGEQLVYDNINSWQLALDKLMSISRKTTDLARNPKIANREVPLITEIPLATRNPLLFSSPATTNLEEIAASSKAAAPKKQGCGKCSLL